MNQIDIKHMKKFVSSLWQGHRQDELYYSDAECKLFFETIKNNPLSKKHFYLAIYLPTSEFSFQYYLSEYFGMKRAAMLNDFFEHIHPDYKDAYLQWAKSIYMTVAMDREIINVLDSCYKIMLPLRKGDGEYYWVLQESYALQLDGEKQLISQFNTYTIIGKYELPQEMFGWLSKDLEIDPEKDAVLKRFYNQMSNFKISKREKELFEKLRAEPNLAYKTIAEEWDVSEDNIKKHAKSIIEKAKTAFPSFFHKHEKVTLKSVINYLIQLDFQI